MKRIWILTICFLLILTANTVADGPSLQVDLVYEVQQGDTLYELAQEFDLKVRRLRKVNDLRADAVIKVGDELIIPEVNIVKQNEEKKRLSLYKKKKASEKYKLNYKRQYNVRIKETSASKRVQISNLRTLNYYVRAGDNLYELAREFRTSIAVIKKLNDLDKSNVIREGDKIELPINNLTEKEVIYHTINDKEFELLARLIHGEARGERYIGQVAVGAVILNRVLSPYFPNDIREVIYQPGQFSPVSNGQINLRPNRTSYRAARAALQGQDPTRGACYFYNPRTAENKWWFESREVVVKIGNHVFAK